MELQTVARCYAQALFNLEKNVEIKEFLAVLSQLWQNTTFAAMVNNPLIPKKEKSQIIFELFAEELSEYMQNFIKLLCEKKRFNCIRLIDQEFNKLVAQVENINYIRVETANVEILPEHGALQHKLEEILKIKIELKIEKNTALIAGTKITLNDSVIDGSFKAVYDNLHASLLAP